MLTVQPLGSQPTFQQGPMIMIPYTIDPTQPFAGQTVPNGTTVTRVSDSCEWSVVNSFPWPNYYDRIVLILSLVTPPTTPIQMISVRDTLNIGS